MNLAFAPLVASALRSGGVVVFRWRWRTGVVKDDDDDDAGDDGSTSEKKKSCANRKSHVSYSAPGDRGTSNSPVSARGALRCPSGSIITDITDHAGFADRAEYLCRHQILWGQRSARERSPVSWMFPDPPARNN